ncbi:AraC family transcriptional regulator [Aquimarina sp. BL5]|uniref:helix-turn-helix domain-containing protein n=2 Tax=Aquimarina sp. BL5 TaxID=1714860 RepID=UPI000E5511D7|nr:helix-turn-helix domain-containing protein [Aquimarina sp. BL5]AXT53393.1 AraC family transcriptional regulator [Aquimarina sp. BL5]
MKLALNFVLVIGIVLSILPIIGIVKLKEKKLPHYLLIVFWILILNIIIYFYATLHELTLLQFITNYLQNGVRFLIPPLLYVYVKSIFFKPSGLIRENIKHFIVFFIYFTAYILPKSLYPNATYIYTIHVYVPNWAIVQDIFGILYFIAALHLFYKFKNLLKVNYSNIREKDVLWIEKFLISFLIVLIVDLIITIVEIIVGYYVDWDAYITVFFLIFAMFYLGYYGLTQSTVFLPSFLTHMPISNDAKKESSYLKSIEKSMLKEKFRECMNEQKIFLLQDLNLKLLADKMDTSERKLSAFFSEVLSSNFHDTINAYRVEEAKAILTSKAMENHSIVGIGLSCGFSSKSSFYRIFKKSTSLTPLEYVKQKS